TDAWRNSLDHYQEFVIIVALDLKIEGKFLVTSIGLPLKTHLLMQKLTSTSFSLTICSLTMIVPSS
ncbi:hypothetical protein, partial [Lacticaseibacillus paracasei]|uniref:hypothetical protein n=1 Tax=Lacticaseibacillus paracasei TaxID=1597 RepID=UPI0025A1E8FF